LVADHGANRCADVCGQSGTGAALPTRFECRHSKYGGQLGEIAWTGSGRWMRKLREEAHATHGPIEPSLGIFPLYRESSERRVTYGQARPGQARPVAEFFFDGERLAIPALGRVEIAPLLRDATKLVVAFGQARPVAEFFLDGERLAIPALGRVEVAPLLRDPAKPVVACGQARPVAEFFLDGERLAIPALGRVEVAPLLRDPAKPVVDRR
jgi:hypothetical protein